MEKYRLKLYIFDIYIDSWIFENDKFEKKRYLARDIHIDNGKIQDFIMYPGWIDSWMLDIWISKISGYLNIWISEYLNI